MRVKEWVKLPDGMTLHTPCGVYTGACPKKLVPDHVKTTPCPEELIPGYVKKTPVKAPVAAPKKDK